MLEGLESGREGGVTPPNVVLCCQLPRSNLLGLEIYLDEDDRVATVRSGEDLLADSDR